jgi:hypothetical protein
MLIAHNQSPGSSAVDILQEDRLPETPGFTGPPKTALVAANTTICTQPAGKVHKHALETKHGNT